MPATDRTRRLHFIHAWILLTGLCLPAVLAFPGVALGAKGDSRAGLFLGTSTQSVDGLRTFGTVFGGNFGFEFEKDLIWTIGGAFTSTDGETVVTDAMGNSQIVSLKSNTAALRSGLLAYFNRKPDSIFVYFLAGGLSVLNYDFQFGGTSVGDTSGTVPGVFGNLGLEIRFTQSSTVILSYGVQVHRIDTQAGEGVNLISGGLLFSFRISG